MRLQGEAGGGEVWPPGDTQPEVAGVNKDGLDKRPRNKSCLRNRVY